MRFPLFPLLLTVTSAAVLSDRQSDVCQQIASSVAGPVYYPQDVLSDFYTDIDNYMTSSTQTPMCVVEVTDDQDVSIVLQIVGETRTPFAVKSGGHASNPGFTSTTGVFISLVQINQITLSADKSSVEIGLGNVRFPPWQC
jgi:hypothetical protein